MVDDAAAWTPFFVSAIGELAEQVTHRSFNLSGFYGDWPCMFGKAMRRG
jgi:hypothetical protein